MNPTLASCSCWSPKLSTPVTGHLVFWRWPDWCFISSLLGVRETEVIWWDWFGSSAFLFRSWLFTLRPFAELKFISQKLHLCTWLSGFSLMFIDSSSVSLQESSFNLASLLLVWLGDFFFFFKELISSSLLLKTKVSSPTERFKVNWWWKLISAWQKATFGQKPIGV